MKKLLFIVLASGLAICSNAQTEPTKKEAKMAVKEDVKDLRAERSERNTKIAHGHFKAAHHDQKEINADRKNLNANKKHLKNKGVKHPIDDAKDEIDGKKP
ncbi:hypothetical protein [Parasediminibacterium sp. JCM 36343]|uniref:hypothetical protein n=1 Tax=Parasediminibacterium sp. JCM 36343 TaxID=3374279 RepID=UPI00397E1E6D